MMKRSVFSPLSKLILGQEKNWHQLHHQSEAEISKCSRVFLLLGMHFSWWNFFIEFLCFNVPVQRYPRALRWGWNLCARASTVTYRAMRHHPALIKRVSSPEYSWLRAHPSNLLLFAKELIYYLWSRYPELFPIMMIMLETDWPWPGLHQIRT